MWRRTGIAGCIGLLLAGLIFLVLRKAEPTYRNRRISLILDDFAAGDWAWVGSKESRFPYEIAFREIGTNTLPYVVRNLVRHDSTWRKKYREALPKLPKIFQKNLPQPKPDFQDVHGAMVFSYLGAAAVPQAITLLRHDSPTVRRATALGLGSLRGESTAASAVISALSEALQDSDLMARFHAAWALKEMGPDASNAVPALTRVVADSDVDPQTNGVFELPAIAASALGRIGPAAKQALPTLKAALRAPIPHHSDLRVEAAIAIWRIAGDADTALPVLIEEMELTQEFSRPTWIALVGEMGPRARAAIPQLERELSRDKITSVLKSVTNALLKIDPEAAAKVGVFPATSKY